MKVAIVLMLAVQFLTTSCIRQSLLNPSWKNCVHRLNAKRSWQEFVSPGYPNGITTQTQCSWIISANTNQRIKLAFYTLNLTGSVNNCFTQFVEIWEFKTVSSRGRFCGDQRPGDYVTFSYMTRVDLKADTAAAGHQGFIIKYKVTKEPGGFKKTFSFQHKIVKQKNKSKKKNKKDTGKSPPNPLFNSNGGRINLGMRKKNREKGQRKPAKATLKPNKRKPVVYYRPAPIRTLQHQPVNSPATPGRINISIEDEESSLPFELWIIIVIGAGGLLFLIFLAFLTWFCFCRKRNRSDDVKQASLPLRTPLNTQPHPIQRRHELPRMPPSTTEAVYTLQSKNLHPNQTLTTTEPVSTLPDPMHSLYMPPAAPLPLQALPQRAQSKGAITSLFRHGNVNSGNVPTKTVCDNLKTNHANQELQNQLVTPYKGGYLYHCPAKSQMLQQSFPATAYQTSTSSSEDEGIVTDKIRRTKSFRSNHSRRIPTLKRKFSQWEKEEIRKGTLKC